jgi:5-methyltetrahydropteroyltriglutamate--homocysteine methyltransferase
MNEAQLGEALLTHNLGYPRIGEKRELKKALEQFWSGRITSEQLRVAASTIQEGNWQKQGKFVELVPTNDFSLYDHVLDTSVALGFVPNRFRGLRHSLERYFAMARGAGEGLHALELRKWFNTNYHYLVPELDSETVAEFDDIGRDLRRALALGLRPRPVLVGPLTYLHLARADSPGAWPVAERILPILTERFSRILQSIGETGVEWVQIDEPVLATDLSAFLAEQFAPIYRSIRDAVPRLRLLVATYFGPLRENLKVAFALPVEALHLDLCEGTEDLPGIMADYPQDKALSLGVISGRNIWAADLHNLCSRLDPIIAQVGERRIMLAPSCSLLHVPITTSAEVRLSPEIRTRLAFADQKLEELQLLRKMLLGGTGSASTELAEVPADEHGPKAGDTDFMGKDAHATAWSEIGRPRKARERQATQQDRFRLPLLPTTTIGSLPQSDDLRKVRSQYRSGKLAATAYDDFIRGRIEEAIRFQEEINLDVLVHGEFERTDMVEFFAEQLAGFAVTEQGWVQSYGSRCVKPPIIVGDVHRKAPITVELAVFAQSLTHRPVKGMLTGPVTMLQWSFPREDLARSELAFQIAEAVRGEVLDLEQAGVSMIQIDEPALREGLPLRRADWDDYLLWATAAFRACSRDVRDETQIHTHMCYSEFGDIIDAIFELDADVISIEAARSEMELLAQFRNRKLTSALGPGIFDVHSAEVPDIGHLVRRLRTAQKSIPPALLWVNPDCGLKTRRWEEVKPALANMVQATRLVREKLP